MPEIKPKFQVLIIIAILLAGASLFWGSVFYSFKNKRTNNINSVTSQVPILEEEVALKEPEKNSTLDGIMENPFPKAVMIDNLSIIRPQYGLSKASVVYEALVEGGATRLIAIYDSQEVERIGPVRSARSYFLEWVSEYNALFVHCGGSQQALQAIYDFDLNALNQMVGYHASYFWRTRDRLAPHNLYTSIFQLDRALRDREAEPPKFEPWEFKDEEELNKRPEEEKSIKINFSGRSYLVEYKYDRGENVYLRFNGGLVHSDALDNNQIKTKNIIVQIIPPVKVLDRYGRLELDVTGEGRAIMCNDGLCQEGIWKKPLRVERTRFYLEDGSEFRFNRGNTWVEILPEERSVEYN